MGTAFGGTAPGCETLSGGKAVKIIVAGNGKMGATLTRQLAMEGHDLTLVDSNSKVLENTQDRYDVMVIHGNCATMDVLKQAGVKEADLLIAMAGEDEINLLCCMTAHAMNPRLHTIARVRNPEYTQQIYKMRDMFGLSMAVNPGLFEEGYLCPGPGGTGGIETRRTEQALRCKTE